MVPHFRQQVIDTIFVGNQQDLLARKLSVTLLTVVITYYIVVFIFQKFELLSSVSTRGLLES